MDILIAGFANKIKANNDGTSSNHWTNYNCRLQFQTKKWRLFLEKKTKKKLTIPAGDVVKVSDTESVVVDVEVEVEVEVSVERVVEVVVV